MKQRIFGWISAVIDIVLALAVVEVTAIAWLYIEDGRYTPAAELYERTQNTYVRDATKGVVPLRRHTLPASLCGVRPPRQPAVRHVVGQQCRPVRPRLPGRQADRPLRRPADRRLGRLAARRRTSKPPAPRYLEEELNKKYVSPNGKPWLVLNGGDGAWKEPQSFILFALYASSVDAVVNAGRLQRALFLLAEARRSGSSGRSATSSRSIRSSPTRISATRRSAG